jgi:phytoene synthase
MPTQGHAPDPGAEWRFPNRATPPGSSAYYSVCLAPAGLRDDLAVVLAWRDRVRAVLDEVSDAGVALTKLQWWREELDRTYAGEARHPLSLALAQALVRHGLPAEGFLRMAAQVQTELTGRPPADRAGLEGACEADMGALFELVARCHGVSEPGPLDTARVLGAFCAQVYLIRDSGLHLRRGRAFLPADRLAQLGLTHLALRDQRGRLSGLLAEAAGEALAYRQASALGPELPLSLPVTLRVRGRILAALLAELDAEGFDLAERRVGLTPVRKLWLAWREARRRV